jgi:hypothetical protein
MTYAFREPREGLKNSILQFFRRRESGAGPDSLALNQAHACLIRERAIHGAREAPINQSFPSTCARFMSVELKATLDALRIRFPVNDRR